jgi:ABC-2 type transport system ATP-binding protein
MAADKIIVISTHLLEEVDALCNRAIIIAHGRILADDTPSNLEAKSKFHNAVSIKLANPALLQQVRSEIEDLKEVDHTEIDEHGCKLTAFPGNGHLPLAAISALASARGWEFAELHLESGRMDEVFRTITGGAAA